MIPDLLPRLIAATGPDRGLDVEIMKLIGISTATTQSFHRWKACKSRGDPTATLENFLVMVAPRFTASIDAAMTLILPGSFCNFLTEEGTHGFWQATVVPPSHPDMRSNYDRAPTPALALCIAALKARTG